MDETSDIALDLDGLVSQMSRIFSDWGAGDPETLERLISPLAHELDEAEFAGFLEQARITGETWGFHPPAKLARHVSRAVMKQVALPGSRLDHADRLEIAREKPVVFLGNHLSFVDANVFDHLLHEAGFGDVSDRVTTLVGPKVFTVPVRRLASLTFGTIKIPQSTSRASGEAVMSARDVARLARDIFRTAADRQQRGDHLLVFPEGSRSRTGAMQPCLAAVARYLEHPDAVIVPFGLAGCEKLVPLHEDHVYPAVIRAGIGVPVPAGELLERADRRAQAMHAVGYLIADTLPQAYRGHYDGRDPDGRLAGARALADELSRG
jgi:1-acyl-sn-glycerol-3-phosphate acyltransferase